MTFKIGLARKDITPVKEIYLAGYAARNKPSVGVHDPLSAKALYIEGDNTLAIIALDLVSLPLDIIKESKKLIKDHLDLKNVIIACTHTHSGPQTVKEMDESMMVDEKWLGSLSESIKEVVEEAIASKQEGKLGYKTVEVDGIGENRRGNEEIIDSNLGILKAEDMEGNLLGLFLNFTCHATVLDASNYLISADYPGFIYSKINDEYPDLVTLFTNGAAGDINIGYSADDSALGETMEFRTYENAEKIGEKIASVVLQKLDTIPVIDEQSLEIRRLNIRLPLNQKLPSTDELLQMINDRKEEIRSTDDSRKKKELKLKQIYNKCLWRKKTNRAGEKSYLKSEIYVVNIVGLNLVTIPGEVFCEIGLKIKSLFTGDTFIIGYANDYVSYIPTESAFKEGGYEVETSVFAPEIGRELLTQVKNVIQN